MLRSVDPLRVGRALRALRIRRGWRQQDAASAAGLSRSLFGRIERGELARVCLGDLEGASRVLGADLDVRIRWHGEGLDRLLDATHAAMVESVVAMLQGAGWETAVEVSFNFLGERGSVDVVGWHPVARALLIVEVKSVIPDAQSTISTHDRKSRLAASIGELRGWRPQIVGRLLVVAESSTSRGRVHALDAMFRTAYPDRAVGIRGWLREPSRALSGLLFLRVARGPDRMRGIAGRQRVRTRGTQRTGP
jgi:transcriptional regulator with XRE-family HTH domain